MGDAVLYLSEHHGDCSPGAKIVIETTGLAAYHADLLAKKYGYARPGLVEQPWGATSMTIADPFFNRIEFSERRPGGNGVGRRIKSKCPNYPKSKPSAAACSRSWRAAKIVKAEARRKDLRFPFQKDFVARLDGQTVTGLGRRAKYLMADLGSGDVLLMHLGMSGSFRVVANEDNQDAGQIPPSAQRGSRA